MFAFLQKNKGECIEIIYLSKNGDISKRLIEVQRLSGNVVFAYCFLRKNLRTFKLDHILAALPKHKKDQG